jgi:tetratricopeptide (TPR) repeat protein
MKRLATCALALAGFIAPLVASADTPPDGWTRIADPRAVANYNLHKEVERLLSRPDLPFPFALPVQAEMQENRARDLLEQANAENSGDVVLMFDLGVVYRRLDLYDKARRVLEAALARAPEHPMAEQSWFDLAIVYAKLDRPMDERRAYREYLARATRPGLRATALSNLAETEMRLGNLSEAIVAYREAMAYANAMPNAGESGVLALWGLVVALDRYGDTTESQKEADRVVRLDRGNSLIANDRQVFFVPDYERAWYLALGAAARARQATDPRGALAQARAAEGEFAEYVAKATTKDRWKPLAERHLTAARKERQRLEAVVRLLPRAPQRAAEIEIGP